MQQVFVHYEREGPPAGSYEFCPFCGARLTRANLGGKERPACSACGFVQFRNPAPTVSVLVVKDGRILLGRRLAEPGRGTWSIPSGYVEFDDDFLTAAVREVNEETGLEIRLRGILNVVSSFVSAQFHFLGVYLVAEVIGGELAAADDLAEVAWFPLAGPLPPLGFEEDRAAIERVAEGGIGLGVDADPWRGRGHGTTR